MTRRSKAVTRWQFTKGFSLVELMISMTLGLFLLVAIGGALLTSSTFNRTNARTSELQTNGQYALEVMRRDLLHAGYRGLTSQIPSANSLGSITNECVAGFVANVGMGVWGANDNNPFSGSCIPAANYRTGDILAIRRAGNPVNPPGSLSNNTIYLRSAYERGVVFLGSAPPTPFTEIPKQDFTVEASVYYISPYTNSTTENPTIPALYRVTLQPGPTMANPELVATGIEDLQVRYGYRSPTGTMQYLNANQVSTSATSTTTTANEWHEIRSVRIWLLARTTSAESGYTNTNTYTMGDRSVTVNDGFRRQLFSTVIQLRNH